MNDMSNVAEQTEVTTEVSYWIDEMKEEICEIDDQQHELIRRRTNCENTLRWLENLDPESDT